MVEESSFQEIVHLWQVWKSVSTPWNYSRNYLRKGWASPPGMKRSIQPLPIASGGISALEALRAPCPVSMASTSNHHRADVPAWPDPPSSAGAHSASSQRHWSTLPHGQKLIRSLATRSRSFSIEFTSIFFCSLILSLVVLLDVWSLLPQGQQNQSTKAATYCFCFFVCLLFKFKSSGPS